MPQLASSKPNNHHSSQKNQQTVLTNNLYFWFLICDSFVTTCSKPQFTRKIWYTMCHVQKVASMRPNLSQELQLQKGERVRISEKEVLKWLALQDNDIQIWKVVHKSFYK